MLLTILHQMQQHHTPFQKVFSCPQNIFSEILAFGKSRSLRFVQKSLALLALEPLTEVTFAHSFFFTLNLEGEDFSALNVLGSFVNSWISHQCTLEVITVG